MHPGPVPVIPRQFSRPGAAGTPAAACSAVRDLIEAGRRPARVLGVFPSAVYLEVPGAGVGGVVALVCADAVRLPNALVLAAPAARRPFAAVHAEGDASVGDGGVSVGPLAVTATRWWRPEVARPPSCTAQLERGLARLSSRLAAVPARRTETAGADVRATLTVATAELVTAATVLDLRRAFAAADGMLGLGGGLTPSGDDILGGFLVALAQLSAGCDGELRAFANVFGTLVVTRAGRATTTLSAALLAFAARGHGAAAVTGVVAAVAGWAPVSATTAALLALGHSSGYDLARGIEAGARVTHRRRSHAKTRP